MITRRDLLKTSAAFAAMAALPRFALAADHAFAPRPGEWRAYDLTTRLAVPRPEGAVRAWVPLPSFATSDWFRSGGSRWTTNAKVAEIVRDPVYGAELLRLAWAPDEVAPVVEVTSRVQSRDRFIDLSKPSVAAPVLSAWERELNLRSTAQVPLDGIVRQTSDRITAGRSGEIEKIRAIYEWMVENTYREASVRGCGTGDVVALLQSGRLGGKCADLNALFVGLARAAGIPARDLYGIRVAASEFGYNSLGPKTETITKAQHCRAEVFLSDFGWVPMDPADVRKVMLEETPEGLPLSDPRTIAARQTLFGAWEGNWVPYNSAHDLALAGSEHGGVGFLMYPQAETAAARLDCLDPDAMGYSITARPVAI